MAQIIELILTHDRVGKGMKDDPIRLNTQLFSKSGELIAERDDYTGTMSFFPSRIDFLNQLGMTYKDKSK